MNTLNLPVGQSDETRPWMQQAGEPDHYFAVFVEYLRLGQKRSVRAAVEARRALDPHVLSKTRSCHVCAEWGWCQRAAAWDAAQQEAAAQAAAAQGKVVGQPWEQRLDEKDHWYRVFRKYLELGPARNVHRAAVLCIEEDTTSPDPVNAYMEARRRRWQERAEAWDEREGQGAEEDIAGGEEGAEDGQEPIQAWDRQPGEPMRAFGFFCHFLELGANRSVARAVRDLTDGKVDGTPALFYQLARRWKWDERAIAWDGYQRDRLAEVTLDLRAAYEARRIAVAEVHFDRAVAAFDVAEIEGVSRREARRLLPTIHRIMMDSATMQRSEWDALDRRQKAKKERMSADKLDQFVKEIERRRAERGEDKQTQD